MKSSKQYLEILFSWIHGIFLKAMIKFVQTYDSWVYSPLQLLITPLVESTPRMVNLGDKKLTIFTANIVTIGRTLLILPIAICLKYSWNWPAFLFVLFHDFLDHLDGIVAKVHKKQGFKDDPNLGSFLDAFCDKVVNCTVLWTLLLFANYSLMTWFQTFLLLGICFSVIFYEIVLGIVRIQDFFAVQHGETRNLEASMEGKLKEKLESIGLSLLCLTSPFPVQSYAGVVGMLCFLFTLYLAHSSLDHKLKGRKKTHEAEELEKDKYDKVYTIGCFDLLHRGHRNLFRTMRSIGKTVIVGVHSDESIFKLKGKWPIDHLDKRMANVKKYADIVFAIPDTDPTPYIMSATTGDNSVFIRGDDMPNFPSRAEVEKHMDVRLIPYTQGISSTMLRKKLLEEAYKNREGPNNHEERNC